MTINCTLEVNGVLPEESLNAFKNAYNVTSKMSHYKKFQDEIESYFLSRVSDNMRHQGINDKDIISNLGVNITNDRIEFKAANPRLVNAIEYGSAHEMGRRFMQPSVMDVGNLMSKKIISEAINYYSKHTFIKSRTENVSTLPDIGVNKYNFMLK